MKMLQHPNIIKLYQVINTVENVYLVLEYAGGGELKSYVEKLGHVEEETRRLFLELAWAILFCHQNGIAHHDLKPENILLDGQGHIKLGDFGLGRKLHPGERVKGYYGTFGYCAPEVFTLQQYDGLAADIWSLGVVLYFIAPIRRHRELQNQAEHLSFLLHHAVAALPTPEKSPCPVAECYSQNEAHDHPINAALMAEP
ncbi:sperm motility kinase X-like [Nannospalax galili]|uniref:sperm motility kinase X-like n=1 Tax=Nannospalax galili TaxID=1026970 RepID=UPI00111C09D9|nr:sperm motility kinase X-like [Nannospalax galili]